jgi:hypothetical protein
MPSRLAEFVSEMMNGDSARPTASAESLEAEMEARPSGAPNRQAHGQPAAPPASRVEAQLRARVVELEARLVEVTRCLEAAEHEADLARGAAKEARIVADDVERAHRRTEDRLAVICASRSWRITSPLRSGMRSMRGRLGR